MATGFGFCANCGTAIGAAGQKFCPTCGAVLPATVGAAPTPPAEVPAPPPAPVFVPPVAVPTPPPLAAPTPPPAPAYQQPQSWAPPPPPPAGYGQPQAWGVPAGAPQAAPARTGISPVMLVVGAVVIAAVVVGAFFVVNNKPNVSPSASLARASSSTQPLGGAMIFSPATITCPDGAYTTAIVLPASVKATDKVTYKIDTTTVITQTVTEYGFQQETDGTWSLTDTNSEGSSHCDLGPGAHTARLVDAGGKVLAQGAFTFVMSTASASAAEPTQAPTPTLAATPTQSAIGTGSVTINPSKFSCSAASVTVYLEVRLPGTIPADAQISSELDGVVANTSSASVGFEKQADGTWLSTGTTDSTTLCSELSIGDHTISAIAADGTVLAVGGFTLMP